MKKKNYYSTSEIAVIFAVQRATIFNWIKDGKLPNAQLVGTSYGVPRHDVLKLIKQKINETEQTVTNLKKFYEELGGADLG